MTMHRTLSVLTAGLFSLVASQSARAAVSWSFTGDTGTGPYAANTLDPQLSSASLAVASGGTVSIPTTGGDPTYFLQIAGNGQSVNGTTLTFALTTQPAVSASLGYLTFNYDLLGTRAPTSITWSWTITAGGSGSGTLATTALSGTGWQSATESLSTIPPLTGSETIHIVGTLAGAPNGSGGNIGFDNFFVPVPEPVHYALAVFGMIFVTTGVGRRYHERVKRA